MIKGAVGFNGKKVQRKGADGWSSTGAREWQEAEAPGSVGIAVSYARTPQTQTMQANSVLVPDPVPAFTADTVGTVRRMAR